MEDYRRIKKILSLCILLIGMVYYGFQGVQGEPQYQYEAGKLYVHVLDVDQGDSIFIRTPEGKHLLIDGGPHQNILEPLGTIFGFGNHKVDYMVLTHPHADHVSGFIEVLRRYEVENIWYTGAVHTTATFKTWLQELKKQNKKYEIPAVGIHEIGGVEVEVLYPLTSQENKADWIDDNNGFNDTSIILKITYGNISFLFPGDAELALENYLMQNANIQADVLKVGHQGSRTSTQESFLDMVDPSHAVISVGENQYGHPHASVLRRLNKKGVQTLRTDNNGTITYETDGSTINVYTEF